MGLAPHVWGPCAWTTFHLFVAGAPAQLGEADRARYAAFFAAVAEVLPCGKCSTHFKQVLADMPLTGVDTREALVDWMIAAHNRVNADLGKPLMDEAAARARWAAVASGARSALDEKTNGGAGMGAGASAGIGLGLLVVGIVVGSGAAAFWFKRQRTRSRR
jgi:hypothetical protein